MTPTNINQTMKNLQKKYKQQLSRIRHKHKPKKIKWHTTQLINKENGSRTYKYNELTIVDNYTGLDQDLYPLSHNEIITILEYYGLINKLQHLTINHYPLHNTQGQTIHELTQHTKQPTLQKEMKLWTPSQLAIKMTGKTKRQLALFVLLHEISHALGNAGEEPNIEKEADRFAEQEYPDWTKIMPRMN